MTITTTALARTHTSTTTVTDYANMVDGRPGRYERTTTEETGRIEFIYGVPGWVFVKATTSSWDRGTWHAYTESEAEDFLLEVKSDQKSIYRGEWKGAESKVDLVGEAALPARRVEYSWGEGANRFAMVALPESACPVIRYRWRGRTYTRTMQAFTATYGGYTSNHIYFDDA